MKKKISILLLSIFLLGSLYATPINAGKNFSFMYHNETNLPARQIDYTPIKKVTPSKNNAILMVNAGYFPKKARNVLQNEKYI